MRRRNPIAAQPDLFGSETATIETLDQALSMSKSICEVLDNMSPREIELAVQYKDEIEDYPGVRKFWEEVEGICQEFRDRISKIDDDYEESQEDYNRNGDGFDHLVEAYAHDMGDLVSRLAETGNSVYEELCEKYGTDTVNEVLTDTNMWEFSTSDGDVVIRGIEWEDTYEEAFEMFASKLEDFTEPGGASYIPRDILKAGLGDMVSLDKQYLDDIGIRWDYRSRISRSPTVRDFIDSLYGEQKVQVILSAYGHVNIHCSVLWDSVMEALGEAPKKDDKIVPTEKVVQTYTHEGNTLHLVRLAPEDLLGEGTRQGICVGQPHRGYGAAVRQGRTAIFSLRTEVNKPKFTIEAALANGKVVSIKQIKGKGNRLPSSKFETEVLVQVVKDLGVDPKTVRDLQPALEKFGVVRENPSRRPKKYKCCGFCGE